MKGEFVAIQQKKGAKCTTNPGYLVHPTEEEVQSEKRKEEGEESVKKRMKMEEENKEVEYDDK